MDFSVFSEIPLKKKKKKSSCLILDQNKEKEELPIRSMNSYISKKPERLVFE